MKLYFELLFTVFLSFNIFAQQSWIRVNQLGYNTGTVKQAVFVTKAGDKPINFELIDVLSDKVVYSSSAISEYGQYACFDNVYRLDFTDLNKTGTYYLRCDETKSVNFKIGTNVYKGAADFLLKYMRQQRCGYNPYLKDSCHTHDGFIVDHPTLDSTHIDVTGGWHDASDYLQYLTTSANATYQMLFAYQQNPGAFGDEYDASGLPGKNGIPDILDEAKWGLDWLVKMNPEYGVMFNQIADDRDHMKFTLPTLDSVDYGKGKAGERPVYLVTGKRQGLAKYKNRTTGVSSSAAKFASAFSLGADLLKNYYPQFAEKVMTKAREAYKYALSDIGTCQTACNKSPYFYEEDNYTDDLELAASQLFNSTKDEYYNTEAVYWGDLEPVTPWMGADSARHYQWYPFVNLGHFNIAKTGNPKFLEFMKRGLTALKKRADNGFLFGVPFIWCSNNLVAAALTQCRLYNELTGSNEFVEMETALRDWLFGVNPWGTCMIVGFPQEDADTPTDPHSALTAAFNMPIDGGLVDGPVYTSIFNRLKGLTLYNGDEYAEFQSDLVVYHDDYGDYSTNEPTMDGTASLTYYLSAMEKTPNNNNYSYSNGGIIRGDKTQKTIYLTFTGDEYSDGGEVIRNLLDEQSIKANFFFTGNFYRNNTELVKSLVANGHYLGAHSDKHLLYCTWEDRDSLLVTKDKFVTDLKANYSEMARCEITKSNAGYFLPPYEWYNNKISKWTSELGLQLVNFTPGTGTNADYTIPSMGERYRTSEYLYTKLMGYETQHTLNGHILIMHIGTHPERTDKFYNKLTDIITNLKTKGYKFEIMDF